MAKKQSKPTKEETLETILFNCRNSLRGRAAMTDKRDLLLTLVFLKFIGERFKEQREKIRHEIEEVQGIHDEGFIEMQLQRPNQYQQDGVFFLTEETRWEKLILTPATGMAVAFDTAIKKLDDNEPKLKNALPQQIFTKTQLEPGVLKGVVDEIEKIDPKKFNEHDLIGRVYEYFLQAFSINADKEEGEFYTPHSIVELIAALIEPFDGTVYDPCCGSGGMFVQAAKFIEAHGGNTKAVNVYGQESEPATYRLAKMNLAIRGISYHLGNRAVSTFSDDQHKDIKVDYIMANPPFNLKKYSEYGTFETDTRWQGYGVPPTSNANYAWILHMLSKLNVVDGVAGFLLANGALDDDDTKEIRQKLIENDKVEAIIVLPRNMFYSTDISVTLWILNNNKKGGPRHGRMLRNREGEILFVDLRTWNENIYEKKFVKLSEEQIAKVCKIYFDWATTKAETYAEPELYYAAHIDEIKKKGFSLVPSRYIEFVDRKVDSNWHENLESIYAINNKLIVSCTKSLDDIAKVLKLFGSLETKYEPEEIGPYIEEYDLRNKEGVFTLDDVRGISIEKKIIDTKAKMDGVSLIPYKVFKRGTFCFVPITSRNGDKITLSLNPDEKDYIVSSSYVTFQIKDKEIVLPEFLYLWFCRPEFDRYARFNSWGSAREAFSFEDMKRTEVPLPPSDVQQAIVNIYKCANEAKQIAAEADRLSREVCPALLQHIIHNANN
ncbi:MAG: N-6 DNA methylase [Bacteroidales bacterium]|nr:N-6 DNA methylase [Bacteroidales bacterium]